jgi:hypothetical protein
MQLSLSPWLARELEPKKNLLIAHLCPSILHGALVGTGALWPKDILTILWG